MYRTAETPPFTAAEVGPESYPEPPETWTTERVRAYVEAYEHAFVHNQALDGRHDTVHLELYVQEVNATQYRDVFVVRLQSQTSGTVAETQENGTPTTIYWNGAPSPVSYLVTEDRVVRNDPDRGGRVPLEDL